LATVEGRKFYWRHPCTSVRSAGSAPAARLPRAACLNDITIDNGREFFPKAMDACCHARNVRLDFIRPGRPTENGYIRSFNGKLRDECLNAQLFLDLLDARPKFDAWRRDYNENRPHSSIGNLTGARLHITTRMALTGCRRGRASRA
jgi:transposase InsO family protein